jgi:adenylate kinase family enzyme
MEKSKVILICGLPGSGKTFLGKKLSKSLNIEYIDDINSKDRLVELLNDNKSCIISDPHFVKSNVRILAEEFIAKYNVNIEWLFFENNPEQCLKNVNKRNDGRKVSSFIKCLTKEYIIPDGVNIISVWNG